MSGLATASPEPSRSSSSLETVGWASRKRWLGVGSPKSSIRPRHHPGQRPGPAAAEARAAATGSSAAPDRSGARSMYLGITQAPLRVEMNTRSATPLRDSSETMSTPLLPIPTTTHPLAAEVERVGRIDVVVRMDRVAVELTRELRKRAGPSDGRCRRAGRRTRASRRRRCGSASRRRRQRSACSHGGAEADLLAQAEPVGVLAQEAMDLGVVGEVRIPPVHREVREADRRSWRCRCAASDTPRSARWDCGSTSCRRCRRWPRSTCRGSPSRPAPCRPPAR